jgi:hypothetical protein
MTLLQLSQVHMLQLATCCSPLDTMYISTRRDPSPLETELRKKKKKEKKRKKKKKNHGTQCKSFFASIW